MRKSKYPYVGEQTLRRLYIDDVQNFITRNWSDPRAVYPRRPISPSGLGRRPADDNRSVMPR